MAESPRTAQLTGEAQGNLLNGYKYLKEGWKKGSWALSSGVQEAGRTKWNTGGSVWLSHDCEGDWGLEQVSVRGCGGSIPKDTQNLSGHGPGQPWMFWMALLEQDSWTSWPQRSLPTSAILWKLRIPNQPCVTSFNCFLQSVNSKSF